MSSPTALSSRRQYFMRQDSALKSDPGQDTAALSLDNPAPAPSLAAHVANRLTFGTRPGDIAAVEAQGVDAWIAEQLNPGATDTPELAAMLAALPHGTFAESTTVLYDRRSMNWAEAMRPADEVRHATLARMLHSKWQLFEVMTAFWHDHFNVYAYDTPIACLFPEWDRLIRQHALGNFRDFVTATAKHPVMLDYLDNYLSTNAGPNENYARELFELHSLGAISYNAPGGYVDNDVYESSRCFTGWSYDNSSASPNRGKFKYVRDNHDRFQKIVLGTSIPNDQADLADGLKVIDLICNHQGTARHIALKLCQRFVSETPAESIVASSANVFYQNRNNAQQIRLTLAHIFASSEFRSEATRMCLLKRPYDWIISTMRALAIPYIYREGEDAFQMTYMMADVGYYMFGWHSPDGPPKDFYNWATATSMLSRYNFIFRIDAGWWVNKGLTFPAYALMPGTLRTPREIAQWWINRVIQRPVSTATFEGIMVFVAEGRNFDIALPVEQIEDKAPRIAALCTVAPEYMWR